MLLGEYLGTVDSNFRVTMPKTDLLERMDLDRRRRCVLAGKSRDCVSLWTWEVWHTEIQPRIDVILEQRHAVVRIEHLQTVCELKARLHHGAIDERGRIRLPAEFESIIEQTTHKGKLRNVVRLVGCGLHVEIWRPSAWQEMRNSLWPKLWEAIDAVTGDASSDG